MRKAIYDPLIQTLCNTNKGSMERFQERMTLHPIENRQNIILIGIASAVYIFLQVILKNVRCVSINSIDILSPPL